MSWRGLRVALAGVVLALVASACSGLAAPQTMTVTAQMPNASNLFTGSEVRVLGIQVGVVTEITPAGDVVLVEMDVDPERSYPADVGARLVPVTLLGERVMSLEPAYTGGPELEDGAVIPTERTAVPAEVDEVIRAFENFLSAVDENQLADLVDAASDTLADQGDGLNELIDNGSQTLRVLDDSAEDLNGVVTELAGLNETLATRDARIGETIREFNRTLEFLVSQREQIIATLTSLRRIAVELRPLLDEHTEPLIQDLETLATTLGTVDRNLARVIAFFESGRYLFENFGVRAPEFETGRLKLDNEGQELFTEIERRLADRLEGVCARLQVPECAQDGFFDEILPEFACEPGTPGCDPAEAAQAIATALQSLPAEASQQLEAELQQEAPAPQAAPGAPAPPAAETQPGAAAEPPPPQLPLPDPRLSEPEESEDSQSLLDRLLGN